MPAGNPESGSRPRRLAMVAYTHYRTDPRCRREATLAAGAGWDVEFYALSSDGAARSIPCEGVTLHELPLDRYRGGSTRAYLGSYLRFLRLASRAVTVAHRRRPFAVVHVNTMPDFMVLAALGARRRGARVILDVHDVMPEIYMSKFRLPASHWKIRLIRAVEVFSARLAHAVVTAEHPKAELLAEHGVPADRITVLLNLPDEALFHLQCPVTPLPPSDPEADFRLIYHGTLAHRLGLDHAMDALGFLAPRFPGLRLEIWGDGDQLPELCGRAEALGLGDRVWFSRGLRPLEEIIPAISDAHLAVLPTRRDLSTDYMLPTKLLEYLALGLPAIFTPTLTVRRYFGDRHPLYLEDPGPEALAERISWVRTHYAEARRLAAGLQERFFSRYRWSEHARSYLALLDQLAAG